MPTTVGRGRKPGKRYESERRRRGLGDRIPQSCHVPASAQPRPEPLPERVFALSTPLFYPLKPPKTHLKDRAATEAALSGGWFHTGDLAVQHPDGYIEIKDRSKDIIISGGENISSLAVEAALIRHPAVALAAVVARPDETWGETPCAFLELRPGMTATAEELIAFARENLPRFAVPRTVIFGPLPTTATGKIQKFELRQRVRTL